MARQKIIKVVGWVVLASSIFYVGGVIGYLQGYVDGTNAPANACYNVSVGDSVRRGDNASAIKLLDAQLDANIVYHWSLKNRGRSIFDVIEVGKFDKGFMECVASYRKNLPLNDEDKKINSAISSVLHQYSTGKPRRKAKPNQEDAPDPKSVR